MARSLRRITPQFFDPSFTPQDVEALPEGKDFSVWAAEALRAGRAHPPVSVRFVGTVVQEKKDPFLSPEKNRQRAEELEKQADENRQTLEKAIFILSQSATGRAVLEEMTREGYKIVFDDRRTGDRGAGGLCDPVDKLLILHSHENAEYLALLIGHESVHAVQNSRHDLFPSTQHRPEVGIRLSFAIEADAYAQQVQIALELAYGGPEDKPGQVRIAGPADQMRARFPDLMAAAEKVMDQKDALQSGATVAAAFQAFYDNFYLRTFYEDSHIDWACLYAPKAKKSFSRLEKNFTGDVDSDWIKERIQHKGIPYLKKHAPHLDFTDARHSGLTTESGGKVQDFYKRFLPQEKPPLLKAFGVYMDDATAWVLGLNTAIHMVIKPGTPPTKPPLRAAPKRNRKWRFWE